MKTLRLLKRRAGSKRWTELLHCAPAQLPLVERLVALVRQIDPDVQVELRDIPGHRLGAVGEP